MKYLAPDSVDTYLADFPPTTKELLEQLRETIRKAAPEAEEIISYQMPAYKYKGVLVYFAGYRNHIGFYPTASGMKHFADQLTAYKTSKGAVQFPLDRPLPLELISEMVNFRLNENMEKKKGKGDKK